MSQKVLGSRAQRRRSYTIPLYGTAPLTLKVLREKLKRGSGAVRYVYRESEATPEILVANHEIRGRRDLIAVYDHHVTAAMLRQDLYGEDPEDIEFAEWGERKVA